MYTRVTGVNTLTHGTTCVPRDSRGRAVPVPGDRKPNCPPPSRLRAHNPLPPTQHPKFAEFPRNIQKFLHNRHTHARSAIGCYLRGASPRRQPLFLLTRFFACNFPRSRSLVDAGLLGPLSTWGFCGTEFSCRTHAWRAPRHFRNTTCTTGTDGARNDKHPEHLFIRFPLVFPQ